MQRRRFYLSTAPPLTAQDRQPLEAPSRLALAARDPAALQFDCIDGPDVARLRQAAFASKLAGRLRRAGARRILGMRRACDQRKAGAGPRPPRKPPPLG